MAKTYIIKWLDNSLSFLRLPVDSDLELFDKLDEEGNPHACEIWEVRGHFHVGTNVSLTANPTENDPPITIQLKPQCNFNGGPTVLRKVVFTDDDINRRKKASRRGEDTEGPMKYTGDVIKGCD